jgi:hypothetical protein
MSQLAALIVDESKWLPASMGLAFLAVAVLLFRRRCAPVSSRRRVEGALNLFFGVTIATMAFGHFLAVTTKLALGELARSVPLLYAIGVVVAVPSVWLVCHASRRLSGDDDRSRATLVLNGWLAITLVALGLHNLPLAAPALLNIAYTLHSRRAVGWAVAGMAIVFNAGLFIGALAFMASGQSFEQFTGME